MRANKKTALYFTPESRKTAPISETCPVPNFYIYIQDVSLQIASLWQTEDFADEKLPEGRFLRRKIYEYYT